MLNFLLLKSLVLVQFILEVFQLLFKHSYSSNKKSQFLSNVFFNQFFGTKFETPDLTDGRSSLSCRPPLKT